MELQSNSYGIFDALFRGEKVVVYTKDITREFRYDTMNNILDLLRDTIEQPYIKVTFVTVIFDNGMDVDLSIQDFMINLCLWGLILDTENKIEPCHLFFEEKGITKNSIADYINEFCIIPNRNKIDSAKLNDIIYRSHRSLAFVNEFAMFFNNSLNLEDFIEMANKSPEFDSIIHKDYSVYSSIEINEQAMKDTNRLIELILDSKRIMGREHCLIDSFRAKVGVKPKQFREWIVNIGVKPNGEGGIFPYSIDASYTIGGLTQLEYMISDASVGRQAQIISKKNTADSGAFARILGLNSLDSSLYLNPKTFKPDSNYDCHTKNYIKLYVENKTILEMISDRYYRFYPKGMEYNVGIGKNIDTSLIGKTILLRSPITCSSASKGLGICERCYGRLFSTNTYGNIGKYSTEEFSSRLTQKMLSAKHILEAKVLKMRWNIENFDEFFTVNDEFININESLCVGKDWYIRFYKDNITLENISNYSSGDDDNNYEEENILDIEKEYINEFDLIDPEGNVISVHSDDYDNLYITNEFSEYIHSVVKNEEDEILLCLSNLMEQDISLFSIAINNDDLSKALKSIINIININSITSSFNKDTIVSTLLNKMIECDLSEIKSVHGELIIMNQIKYKYDTLLMPDWDVPNQEDYVILTLKQALDANPSALISMQFDNIAKTLYMPITFKKKKASKIDLFYHTQPQLYIKQDVEEIKEYSSPFTVLDEE